MVGSVVLTWNDVEKHRGMLGTFCYVLNDKPMWRDLEMITAYDFCLGDKLKFDVEPLCDQHRILLDRTPDTALLLRWHEEHGQIWPEPVSALPEVVQDMLNEYDGIVDMWEIFYGKVVAGTFDSFVEKNKEQIEKMGVPCAFLDIYEQARKPRKPRKAKVPELAVDSVAVPAVLPAELAVDSVAVPAVLPAELAMDSVAAPVDEIDRKELDERIDEENRERARQRAARRGMAPALVQPPPPPQP